MAQLPTLAAILLILVLDFAANGLGAYTALKGPKARNCQELKERKPNLTSGVYYFTICNSTTRHKFYCDMDTLGGNWTIPSWDTVQEMLDCDCSLNDILSANPAVLVVMKNSNGTYSYSEIANPPQYSNRTVSLSFNNQPGFPAPYNSGRIGPNYIYAGFPSPSNDTDEEQGIESNGQYIPYNNTDCENSYIAVYQNKNGSDPVEAKQVSETPFSRHLLESFRELKSDLNVPPSDFFSFVEMEFGCFYFATDIADNVTIPETDFQSAYVAFR